MPPTKQLSTTTVVTVALSNDYQVVVEGLEQMLAPHADRIQVAELNVGAPVGRPVDLTLYDTFSQPQVDADEIDRVLAGPLSGRVVVYTWNTHERLIRTALDKGVSGYLSKTLSADELVAALERIHDGEVVVDVGPMPEDATGPRPGERDELWVANRDWPGKRDGLTVRESEIVTLITQGLSNQQIAARSYLSINSVKSYIRSAYRKMGVDSRTRAVLWGMDHGMAPRRSRTLR
ncbi:MAG: LuxR C-terminal-related transcriptional regulator [Ornithinimicrobium sp.]|uniref:LuxR C-terminal-related transcriptional regulator n=1 Tax=Ornithinimicrobium sp. TaxID=1977084 RepID=UPI003D9BE17B